MVPYFSLTPFVSANIVSHFALIAKGYILLLEDLRTHGIIDIRTDLGAMWFADFPGGFDQLRFITIFSGTLLHLQQTLVVKHVATFVGHGPNQLLLIRASVLHVAPEEVTLALGLGASQVS